MGFGGQDRAAAKAQLETSILETAKRAVAPELWARIEERLIFAPLEMGEVKRIAARLAKASSERLKRERGIRFELDDAAIDYLVQQGGYDATFGARPMRQVLARLVEGPIAARILEGRLHADEHVTVSVRAGGGLTFLVGEELASLSQRPMHRTQLPRPVAED
jgi:ATP-dependent Clp protease ATP-binding subunit ClpC